MESISEHVRWLPPGPPDRPSLCAVVGERWTLALDAGASGAHARAFLAGLSRRPAAVVYTHSHWDHVFGGVELACLVLAHERTVPKLADLAARDWSDEGLEGYRYADDIRMELPSPRTLEIAPADVVFGDGLELDLGGVAAHVRHVGGDHADDACVVHVEPDRVLFLGDCLSASPDGRLTRAKALPLYEAVLSFDACLYVEGHHPSVTSRAELEDLIAKARAAAHGHVVPDDEDGRSFAAAFKMGA